MRGASERAAIRKCFLLRKSTQSAGSALQRPFQGWSVNNSSGAKRRTRAAPISGRATGFRLDLPDDLEGQDGLALNTALATEQV